MDPPLSGQVHRKGSHKADLVRSSFKWCSYRYLSLCFPFNCSLLGWGMIKGGSGCLDISGTVTLTFLDERFPIKWPSQTSQRRPTSLKEWSFLKNNRNIRVSEEQGDREWIPQDPRLFAAEELETLAGRLAPEAAIVHEAAKAVRCSPAIARAPVMVKTIRLQLQAKNHT